MHFADTHLDSDGTGWLVVRDANDARQLLGSLIYFANEAACTPQGTCLINPPRWAWRIGGHRVFSLGGLLWHLGQWAAAKALMSPEVHRVPLTREELIAFGWSETVLDEHG